MQQYDPKWQGYSPYGQNQQYDPNWQSHPVIIQNQYYLTPPPDYTWKAFFLVFFYFCGYVPALIVNIVLLVKALGTKSQYGEAPGLGCLIVTLVAPPLLFILAFLMISHL